MRRLTAHEKDLRGTLRTSRENTDGALESDFERVPSPPSNWPANIQKLWMDRAKLLKRKGFLSKVVLENLRRYCFAHHLCLVAEQNLLIKPDSWSWIKILDTNAKLMLMISREFGWTPASATRVPTPKEKVSHSDLLK